MRKYKKEIVIVVLQVFLHCVFPLFAGPGDEMGLVLLLMLGTFGLGFLMSILSKRNIKYAYPIVPAVFLIVTIPVYYNASALILGVWYFAAAALGLLLGNLIQSFCRLTWKTKGIIAAVIVMLILAAKLGAEENPLVKFSKETGINISWGDVLEEADSHGGFHGDGTKITIVHYTDSSLEPEMAESWAWKAIPLPAELEKVVYGKTEGDATTGPYIDYDSVGIELPKITHGYYFFMDRHSESEDIYDASRILSRNSFNFTILLYDCDTDLMYIVEEDT